MKYSEPIPTRFYCPESLYQDWLKDGGFPGEWLGDTIVSPGKTRAVKVTSAPCCRLYWNPSTHKAEPHSFERSWEPVEGVVPLTPDRSKYHRKYANYLSYRITDQEGFHDAFTFITCRWERPTAEPLQPKVCPLSCPLSEPLPA